MKKNKSKNKHKFICIRNNDRYINADYIVAIIPYSSGKAAFITSNEQSFISYEPHNSNYYYDLLTAKQRQKLTPIKVLLTFDPETYLYINFDYLIGINPQIIRDTVVKCEFVFRFEVPSIGNPRFYIDKDTFNKLIE